MRSFTPFQLFSATVLALASMPTLAGRPLVTEDAGVLDRAACEWESYVGRTRAGGQNADDWATQVGCGIGLRSQVAVAYGQAKEDGLKPKTWGFSGKTNLYRTGDDSLSLTLAWGLSQTKVLGQKIDGQFLNLVLSKQVQEGLTLHLNLGTNREKASGVRTSTTSWSVAFESALKSGWDVMAEVIGEERGDPAVGLGVRWNLSDRFNLNASLHTSTAGPSATTGTLGAKLAF